MRRHNRRRWPAVMAAVVSAAGLAGCGANPGAATANVSPSTSPRAATSSTGAANSGGGLGALAADHWSALPASPLPPRLAPAETWTGQELLVWGGSSGDVIRNDGAAYDPQSGRWSVLPPSPLGGRIQATSVWTGREWLIWGGYDRSGSSFHVTADGAAYDPARRTWRIIAAAPLTPRAGAIGVWTGREVIVLGRTAPPRPMTLATTGGSISPTNLSHRAGRSRETPPSSGRAMS